MPRKPDWPRILRDAARFHINKARHGLLAPFAGQTVTSTGDGQGFLKEIRLTGRTGSGRLQYCEMRDASGIRRAFQLPWVHVENLLACVDGRSADRTLRRLLARLPRGAACNFVLGKNLLHPDLVAKTFARSGFRVVKVDNFFYSPPAQAAEVIETLTSRGVKRDLRKARRELDLVEVSPGEFVDFYKRNIEAAGKSSYFDYQTDRMMFELGLATGHVRILGARRKATPERPGPFPLDAAMVCTWNPDQHNYKFIRLTHRSRAGCDPENAPQKNASKLLILAAMEDAAALGLPFETDGTTPGMTNIYASFGPGVFQPATRIQCMRETLWSHIHKQYPSLAGKIRLVLGAFAPRTAQ